MAVIAQWQDRPDAVAALVDAAAVGQFDHIAAQLRARQLEDEAVATRCAELTAQGITLVEVEPRRYDSGPARPLDGLRPADSPAGTELSAELHAQCPGHAAYVRADYYEADVVDDEDQPEELELHVIYLCTDADRYGHVSRYGSPPPRRPGPPDDGDGDADDAENAAAQWQARQDEARRVERRELIRLNKEADAAQQVRREFLHQCLTAKSRHKAMTAWALSQVINRDPHLQPLGRRVLPALTDPDRNPRPRPPRSRRRRTRQPARRPALGARGLRQRGRPPPRRPPGQLPLPGRVPCAPAGHRLHPGRRGTAHPHERHRPTSRPTPTQQPADTDQSADESAGEQDQEVTAA